MRPGLLPFVLASCGLLASCEQLGIDDPAKIAAAKEADGKAIGSACRHAQRAIEDCYTLNPKASKAAVFAGWKEMDEYMRENKLEGIPPVLPRPGSAKSSDEGSGDDTTAKSDKSDKMADKADGKGDKPDLGGAAKSDKTDKTDKTAKSSR